MTKERLQTTWVLKDIGGGVMAHFPACLVNGVAGSYYGDPTKGEPCTMEATCSPKQLDDMKKKGATVLPKDEGVEPKKVP